MPAPTTARRPRLGIHRACAAVIVAGALPALASEAGTQVPDAGSVTFAAGCTAAAQRAITEGVTLLHHMTYPGARQAFERAASADPRCAMAHWGVAMTLFQPLWPTRPGPEELHRGWRAVTTATALAPATERERRFIAAAGAFYAHPDSGDYWLRIRRWARAMAEVHAAHPDDDEAATFHALALLASEPSDTASVANERAAAILAAVLERNATHPGAMHYMIHANDAPGRAAERLDVTRGYEATAPDNPHALHMPTHLYIRLGEWDGVIRGNRLAAAAALRHPAGARGEYVWDEFPHAIEYLLYAHLQQGADGESRAALDRLHGTERLQPTFKTAFNLASTQARHALERRAWDEAVRITVREPATIPWDRFPWPEAVAWFGRGLGAVHLGRLPLARQSLDRLAALDSAARGAGEALFASNIEILRLQLDGWIRQVEGDPDSARALLQRAVGLEAATPKHPVTPAPTIPAEELLADLLMAQRRPAEALALYQRALEHYPHRFNSLLGAARAARASGETAEARAAYAALLAVASPSSPRASLQEARAYLAP